MTRPAAVGTVVEVFERNQGSPLADDAVATDTSIVVLDIRLFENATQVRLDTEVMTIDSMVTSTKTINFTAGLAGDHDSGDFVEVYPLVPTKWAYVRLTGDEGDIFAARVRNSVAMQLTSGDRTDADAERVVLERESTSRWIVTDILGKEAIVAADTKVTTGSLIITDADGVTRAIYGKLPDGTYGLLLYDENGVEIFRANDTDFIAKTFEIQQRDTSTVALLIHSAGPSYTNDMLSIYDSSDVKRVSVGSVGNFFTWGTGLRIYRVGETLERIHVHPNVSSEAVIEFSDGTTVDGQIVRVDSDGSLVFRTGNPIGEVAKIDQSKFLRTSGFFTIKKNSAPADGDLSAGECALWFDSTNGASALKIKAKQADGTVKTATVALS